MKKLVSTECSTTRINLAQVSQQEAQKVVNKVVEALHKDSSANKEFGCLDKVSVVLEYGSPSPGELAVRFNAAFKKSGKGMSSVPLSFGLGQSNMSKGRGQMVCQVKAAINTNTGKLTSCFVFQDLEYRRSFNMIIKLMDSLNVASEYSIYLFWGEKY